MNDLETLEDYLKNFDWEYAYIDDGYTYKLWDNRWSEIKKMIKDLGPEGMALYNKYKGKGWGDLKENKPISPHIKEKSDSIMQDLKGNKREFVKRYGKDAEKVMKGRAIQMAKNKIKEIKQNTK